MRYCLIGLVVLLGGCGLFARNLEQCAADYYNYAVGNAPRKAYSSFLSPAYRRKMTPQAREEMDAAMRIGAKVSGRYPEVTSADVFVTREGRFGLSVVSAEVGRRLAERAPLQWVQDGRRWYLYLGSDAEIGRYGMFPETLAPPGAEPSEDEDGDAVEAGEEEQDQAAAAGA